jgi:sugar phosphate isomerase/epimerase
MMMKRRDFLKTAAVIACNAPAFGQAAEVATPKPIVVGAHPWVYAAKQPGYDITPVLDQIFSDMSWAGLDCIELMHTGLRPDNAVERIGELSEKHKLPVIGTSFEAQMCVRKNHNAILEDIELIITRLAKLGGRALGTSVGHAPGWIKKTEEQIDAQTELLFKIIKICDANRVVLNLHNHTYEVEYDQFDLKGTLSRIPDVKLGPDLNWLVRGGADPVKFLRTHGKRIIFLHLRDQHESGAWSEALGEGDMDYAAIAQALRDIKFSGDAIIELAHEADFKPTRPLRESLKMSREFVRSTLGF